MAFPSSWTSSSPSSTSPSSTMGRTTTRTWGSLELWRSTEAETKRRQSCAVRRASACWWCPTGGTRRERAWLRRCTRRPAACPSTGSCWRRSRRAHTHRYPRKTHRHAQERRRREQACGTSAWTRAVCGSAPDTREWPCATTPPLAASWRAARGGSWPYRRPGLPSCRRQRRWASARSTETSGRRHTRWASSLPPSCTRPELSRETAQRRCPPSGQR
mmetsp:Transcript_7503/g.31765  ORF Transcript_7503/g.31765 Transcript_7503/m.31765 type:complete len:217 (-) Transcript_7503:479-1129(-)